MKKLHWLVLVLTLSILVGCARAELPAAPSATHPLVEYNVEEESWYNLKEDEVKRLSTEIVRVRQTEYSAAMTLSVQADIAPPAFHGSMTREDNIIVVQGKGGVVITVNKVAYAKIILE